MFSKLSNITAGKHLLTTGLLLTLAATNAAAAPFAAVLPTSRSVDVDTTATVFATILNPDDVTATNCAIEPASAQDADFFYQTTNPATNELTGTINTPVDIPAGGSQSFVIGLTPFNEFGPVNVEFAFFCGNTGSAPVLEAINTLLLSGNFEPTADMVAVALTPSNDGIASIPRDNGLGFMAVATTNVGVADTITAVPVDFAGLDGNLSICETNPDTGDCLADPSDSVSRAMQADEAATFSVFMSSATRVALDPAARRIALEFRDTAGTIRGRTGTAVAGGGPSATTFFTENVADQIIQNTCSSCHVEGGGADNSGLLIVPDHESGYQATNLQSTIEYLQARNFDATTLLDSVTGGGNHPQVFESGSAEEETLRELVFLISTTDDKSQ